MQHAYNHDTLLDQREEQTIWKVRDQRATLIGLDDRKTQWAGADTRDRLVDRGAELAPEARASVFVPLLGFKQFALGLWPKNNREAHRPA